MPERRPASEAHLAELAAFIAEPIPLDGPLWRARVLADPDGRARAVLVALHHVVTDGVGGLSVLRALVDDETTSQSDWGAPAAITLPAGRPSARELFVDAWAARVRGLRRWRSGARAVASGLRELGARQAGLAEPTTLLAPTGASRRVDAVETDLGRLSTTAHALGATVNDLVLVAIAGALRELLLRRGEALDEVVVSVPVAARSDGTALGNAVGVLPLRIPVASDPSTRLAAVVGQRHRLAARAQRGSSAALLAPVIRTLAALRLFQWFITRQRMVHTFESNVRGPVEELRIAGCRVERIVPMALNPGNVTVSFVAFSAAGRLVVSVVSDPDRVPDHAVLRQTLDRELARLTTPITPITPSRAGPAAGCGEGISR
jgi:WS/DGAT/MGAT family acyltransferase